MKFLNFREFMKISISMRHAVVPNVRTYSNRFPECVALKNNRFNKFSQFPVQLLPKIINNLAYL